jgi:prevent-host-death family protein
MKEIAISEFKAKCLGILENVRKTRKPVRITRFGKPVAEVGPPSLAKPGGRRLGCMAGTIEIVGDIVGPISSWDDWDAARRDSCSIRTYGCGAHSILIAYRLAWPNIFQMSKTNSGSHPLAFGS